jgi:hypothetical protein
MRDGIWMCRKVEGVESEICNDCRIKIDKKTGVNLKADWFS